MNYTLHQLQIFLKVTQLKSITKASEALFLSQPAVSIQLKKFQDQFSVPLTEVVGRQLYVTDFGLEIAEAAEKILNEVQAINYKTLSFKGQISGRLKLSIVSTGKYVKGNYKSIAYVVASNIYNRGLKPSLFFTKPFEQGFKKLPDELLEAYGLDVEEFLQFTLNKR